MEARLENMPDNSRITRRPHALDKFMWKNDLLRYQDRLYLCKSSQLKHKILVELQTSPIGGHSRFLKTYERIKKDFF